MATVTINIPAAVRSDLIDDFGWEGMVEGLGERKGMKDAWTAIQFATPRGSGATYALRINPVLLPILKLMIELRWADHYSRLNELSGPYDRLVDQLTKMTRKKS